MDRLSNSQPGFLGVYFLGNGCLAVDLSINSLSGWWLRMASGDTIKPMTCKPFRVKWPFVSAGFILFLAAHQPVMFFYSHYDITGLRGLGCRFDLSPLRLSMGMGVGAGETLHTTCPHWIHLIVTRFKKKTYDYEGSLAFRALNMLTISIHRARSTV